MGWFMGSDSTHGASINNGLDGWVEAGPSLHSDLASVCMVPSQWDLFSRAPQCVVSMYSIFASSRQPSEFHLDPCSSRVLSNLSSIH